MKVRDRLSPPTLLGNGRRKRRPLFLSPAAVRIPGMLRAIWKLLGLAAALALGWVLLVSLAPGSWIAAGAPCPRNLSWGPAWLPRVSPLESLSFALPGGGKGKLCYGSPSLKGRTMIGGVLPYGQLWRLGANEPTTLHLSRTAHIG